MGPDCAGAYARACAAVGVSAVAAVAEALEAAEAAAGSGAQARLELRGSQLGLFKRRLGNADVAALAAAVRESGLRVSWVDLSHNVVTDAGCDAVVELLLAGGVEGVDLGSNEIGPDGLESILAVVESGRCALRSLSLHHNPLGSAGGRGLARALARKSCALNALDIGSTEQDTDSLVALAKAMAGNAALERVNLDNPRLFSLDDEVTVHMTDVLVSASCRLRELSLGKHRIRCSGAAILAAALPRCRSLRTLSLRGNEISVQGACALAKVLLAPESSLAELDLEGNRVQDEGALAIGASLEFASSALTSLNLASNLIQDRGLAAVARGMAVNGSVQRLCLWGNSFGPRSSKLFYDLANGRWTHVPVQLDFWPHVPPDCAEAKGEKGDIHIARIA
jgi:Ran GTPase-activating protein (RanGAP) involved in mRNA processing and transport